MDDETRIDQGFWRARWDAGQIGFHRTAPNDQLVKYADVVWTRHGRVLVPLCGKSVDLAWLAGRFADVVGVEFVAAAAEAFFADQGVVPERADQGGVAVLRHGAVGIRVQDFLTLEPDALGPIDAVWDRAALIALPPGLRRAYADRLVALMPAGASCLLLTFEYPQALMAGPPFSVGDDEVHSLFSADARLERLERTPVTERRPPALAADVPIHSSTWLITRTPSERRRSTPERTLARKGEAE
ncbi:MAG: thiopurine S-methyltransferase [Myxococcota bacterium]